MEPWARPPRAADRRQADTRHASNIDSSVFAPSDSSVVANGDNNAVAGGINIFLASAPRQVFTTLAVAF